MRNMTVEGLAEVLRRHVAFLRDDPSGVLANLDGANLYGANLDGANLNGASLYGARHILVTGPLGSRGALLVVNMHGDGPHCYTGCFGGTLAEFETAVQEKHGDNEHGRIYRAAITLIRVWAKSQAHPADPELEYDEDEVQNDSTR